MHRRDGEVGGREGVRGREEREELHVNGWNDGVPILRAALTGFFFAGK